MDENCMRLETYEMLKALYDFKASFAKTLSFHEGDYFILYQSSTKQRNWWQVLNKIGQLGYIPSNYVTTVKVEPLFLIDFLEECINTLNVDSNSDKQDVLLYLLERKKWVKLHRKTKKQAPVPPNFSGRVTPSEEPSFLYSQAKNNIKSVQSNTSYTTAQTTLCAKNKPEEVQSSSHSVDIAAQNSYALETLCKRSSDADGKQAFPPPTAHPTSHSSTNNSCHINSEVAYELIDQVRRSTQLSYEMSKVAVTVVVLSLQQLLPESASHLLDSLLHKLETPLAVSKISMEETFDANRLKIIFKELTLCKEDSQQRNWMLYEDESIIVEYIKELTSILTNADANVSRYVLRQDQYNAATILIQYYQMEPRWTIRQLLLQSFGVMCSLDPVVLTIMLNSVLPMELARDMRSNPRNVAKLNYSSLLLTMIFSMGEPMPVTHLEQLGTDFVSFLLNLIEDPPDTDLEDQIPDLLVNLILSYNLQFTTSENIVLNAFKDRKVVKSFTEKILFLFNREEDPVRIFDHEPSPPHSVLKLFIDLFSSDVTASLFYTNDIKVVIDIILRQLFDMFPGDKRRQYLELCRRILRTSGYKEHKHRSEDLLKCFTRCFEI